MKPPLKRFGQDEYAFRWADECVDISLDEIHEARGGELRALMTVKTDRDGHDVLLFQADFNIASTTTRQAVVRSLVARVADLDWGSMLEAVCYFSRERFREGDPLVPLAEALPDQGERFLLKPFVERGGPTVLFAMGGTGKSLFALALAVSISSGMNIGLGTTSQHLTVAYLDWETERAIHNERLRALCAGADIAVEDTDIWYRRQTASLAASAPALRRLFARHNVGFMVVDSLGAARGGEPESADSTIRLFNAARSIGVPWLAVDHMTKGGGADQATPFGSVYTHNEARLTFALEAAESADAGVSTIVLTNRKANNGPLAKRRAYDVSFSTEGDALTCVNYTLTDVNQIPEVYSRLPVADQIAGVLRETGPLTAAMIVEKLQRSGITAQPTAVHNALARGRLRFVQQVGSNPQIWGLKTDRTEPFTGVNHSYSQ